jgi:ubiquitin-protein ligase
MSSVNSRAWVEHNKLVGLHPKHNPTGTFILDTSPFGEDDESIPTDYTFIGRILPTAEPFRQTALKVKFHLPSDYPLVPPEVRILTTVYHPNVAEDGKKKRSNSSFSLLCKSTIGRVCLSILRATESWKPSLFLSDVVQELVKIIDRPDPSQPMNEGLISLSM